MQKIFSLILFTCFIAGPATAQTPALEQAAAPNTAAPTAAPSAAMVTGLPIPRFVSLRTDEANLRTGPGQRYPIDWVLTRKMIPLEVTAEFDTWRRVRDVDGSEGWLHQSMLAGKRTFVIKDTAKFLRKKPDGNSKAIAELQPGVMGELKECSQSWCAVSVKDLSGYLAKTDFWGAYPDEVFE